MDIESAELIYAATGIKPKLDKEDDTVDMCKAYIDMREEGRMEGRTEGYAAGQSKGQIEGSIKILQSMGTAKKTIVEKVAELYGVERNYIEALMANPG